MTDYFVKFHGESEVLVRDSEQKYRNLKPEDAVYHAFKNLDMSERLREEQFIELTVRASIKPRVQHGFVVSAYNGGTGSYTLDEFDDFYHPDLAAWKEYKLRRFDDLEKELSEFKLLIDAINVSGVTK